MIARIFKWLTLSLFAYVVTAFVVHPPWPHVLEHFVIARGRTLMRTWLSTMVGVLGTTITPYLFFWQASLMVEEEKEAGNTTLAARRGTDEAAVRNMHTDVNTGMIFSNLVAFFIIVTTAATLDAHGKHDIATAQQAAEALRPLAGKFAAAAVYARDGRHRHPRRSRAGRIFGVRRRPDVRFREGLNETPQRAPRFYGVIVAGIIVGIAMNLLRIDAIKALFWSAVLNGVAAVPLIAIIVWFASNSAAHGPLAQFADRSRLGMGDRRADGRGDRRHVLLHG